MLSKAKIKFIHSLELKKNRRQEGVFVAEGPKVVGDLLEMMRPTFLIATSEWMSANRDLQTDEWLEVTMKSWRKPAS